MTTNDSKFLSIAGLPPNVDSGWQIRILDYKDMTTLVAICNEFDQFQFTEQLNDPGTGSLSIDTDSPWWNNTLNNGLSARSILDHEYVLEAWEGGVARFAWLAQTVENTIVGEDESHKTTISGPGIAQTLTWACIQRPGWPKVPPHVDKDPDGNPIPRSHSYKDTMPAFLWQFPVLWPTMRMWTTVFLAAQRRGLLRFVKCQFSGQLDSARRKWTYVRTQQNIVDNHGYQPQEPSENLLDFLNECTGRDYTKYFGQRLEWIMKPGFKLYVQTLIGSNRTTTVRFYSGQILTNNRTRDREEIFNRVTAVDVDGTESTQTDKASVAAWNLREQRNETNKNITDKRLRNELALRYIKQSSGEKSQWTVKVPYDDPGRVPYHNFFVGDTIMLANTSGPGGLAAYRIMAISISLTAEQTVPDLELTLQSTIDADALRLQREITQLTNAPANFRLSDLKDIAIPEAPNTKSALVWNPKTRKWETQPLSELTNTSTEQLTSVNVYIGPTDPAATAGNSVTVGDFWFDTKG